MKTPALTIALLSISTLSSLFTAAAYAQGSQTGGGDACKNEINRHRLEIQGWIERDEARELDFKRGRVAGWEYVSSNPKRSYRDRMLEVLAEGRVIVTCYLDPARIADPAAQAIARREGVSYRAVTVNGAPSTCINYEDAAGISHIDCNYDLVMNESSLGNPNFVSTHHEYASIAGVEKRASNPSDFSISEQLNEFEQVVAVKKLGPKRTVLSSVSTRLRPAVNVLPLKLDELLISDGYAGVGKSGRFAKRLNRAVQDSESIRLDAGQCETAIGVVVSTRQFVEENDVFGQKVLRTNPPQVSAVSGTTVRATQAAADGSIEAITAAVEQVVKNACHPRTVRSANGKLQLTFGALRSGDQSQLQSAIESSAALAAEADRLPAPLQIQIRFANRASKYCDLNGANCEIVWHNEAVLRCGSFPESVVLLSNVSLEQVAEAIAKQLRANRESIWK